MLEIGLLKGPSNRPLTTGVDAVADFTGTAADDVFNAPATSATTGAAATTINSGDAINGGAGNDTLNITATATNNNSLTGLTATSIETVNIAGANNLGASSPAYAAAEANKVTTAAALASAQAASNLANAQSAAASAVEVMADTLGSVTETNSVENALTNSTGAIETAVAQAATASVGTASATAAAARYFDAQIASEVTAYNSAVTANAGVAAAEAALIAKIGTLAASGYALPSNSGITAFVAADVRFVAAQSQLAKDGSALTGAADILARNGVLDSAWDSVNVLAASTQSTTIVAAQEAAAAAAISTYAQANSATAATVLGSASGLGTAYTALNTTAFTSSQFATAAANALKAYTGVSLAATDHAGAVSRAAELATSTGNIAGVAGDFSIAQLNAAAAAALVDANGATLRTNGDDSAAIETRTDALATAAATAAGTAATAVTTATANDTAAANAVTVALASVGSTSVDASQFADATTITLSGSSSKANVTAVAATQAIGFSGVAGMDNTVGFGSTVTAGSINTATSAGKLTVTGAGLTSLSLGGAGTTGLEIVNANPSGTTTKLVALNVNTTGATVLTTSGMVGLTSVKQDGAGAVTLTAGSKVALVTTGAGADLINLVTATAIDNPGTTLVETVNASLVSGAGADRLVVATTGTGNTTVDAGADNDTIFVNALGSGTNSISGGDGNDTIRVNTLNTLGSGATATAGMVTNLQSVKIDGGAGTGDALRIANTGFTASDYTILGANVTGIETLQLSATVATGATALDASKISMTRIEFLATGTNVVNEVSSSQTVALVRTPVSTAVTGFIAATSIIEPGAITIASKGYIADIDSNVSGKQTVFGESLKLELNNSAATTAVAASAEKLTMSVTALGNSGTTASPVAGVAPVATVNGDLRSLDVTLTSARGSGTNGAGSENIAGLTVGTLNNTSGSLNLESLSSIKVSGSGAVIINAGSTHTALTGKLTSIDLSGMTALADQNTLGQEIGTVNGVANTIGGYNNLSTSTVTLNNSVSETVILGGAKDTVVTGSTIVARDVVTGFQLTASADPLVVDLSRSDVLKIGVAFDVNNAAKMTTTATSLDAAILEAANLSVGGTAKENVVFHFGGNTYAYVDTGADGLSDNDKLVQLSGTLNLDLLLQSGVIIA